MRRWALAILVGALFALPDGADAAFPGKNGKIAFVHCCGAVDTINPDGSGLAQVPNTQGGDAPVWSPSGQKIAFDVGSPPDVYTINPDGTARTKLTSEFWISDTDPSWSPDGTRIVFTRGGGDLFRVDADGTDETRLTFADTREVQPTWSPDGRWIAFAGTNDPVADAPTDIKKMNAGGGPFTRLTTRPGSDYDPSWSPDNSKIVFVGESVVSGNTERQIYTVNADGTNLTQLTSGPSSNTEPTWSPDGTKIAFIQQPFARLYVMNADGSNPQRVPNGPDSLQSPDWQSIPIEGYPRPKGATPFVTQFTVAYKQCTSPNEQHGAPLAVLSCSPPQQASDFLTVGTLDANGEAANSTGFLRAYPKQDNPATAGDEADVVLWTAVEDVRNKSDLSDYTGELQVTFTRRITDKFNSPSPSGGTTSAATTQDVHLPITIPCTSTSDTTIGGTCGLLTSAEVISPGEVPGNARSNWELGQVQVYDAGPDQDADTTADNTLFMDEGIFVP